ncbi:RNA-guided endonuclease InsQ/TnpB family protein [Moorena bouillonii]|uniref:Transposase n=1 Tax=Moorena bouillonii PNG TaxID=568701 RepID=A0A1U7MYP0_9CYAN|nr:RNA-guided endonuclease TnpB family protein [Moorena bouillonii]OLT58810.1 transposase [Moorena bouillonii PNG]
MLTLTYEYKIKPSQGQIDYIESTLEVCRRVWNFALRERKDWINSRKSPINACSLVSEYIIPADAPYPGFKEQSKALTTAKKDNPLLKAANAQVLQQVIRTLDRAFKDMKGRGFGFPRFKRVGRMRSFVFPQLGKDPLGEGRVKLPGLGWVVIRQSRPYPEGFEVKQARIVRRASGYYVMLSFQCDVSVPELPLLGKVVGVDVGLAYFASTSTGMQIERPKFFVDMQRQLKLLQRRLKRKVKGSANWKKLQHRIARLHEQIANTRKDFHFKVAHQICAMGDVIVVEELNLIALSRGMLGKHMLDAGHGQFLNSILPWVGFKTGTLIILEDAAGTSQECPACGSVVKKSISQRWHECTCGCSMPRDVASGQVLVNRLLGRGAHGLENACGDGLSGARFA